MPKTILRTFIVIVFTILGYTASAQLVCDICIEQDGMQESRSGDQRTSSLVCTDTITICMNWETVFSTTAYTGAIYGWSVIGSNIQIIGPRDQSTVTVKATATGYYTICLAKSVNGQTPCCICKTIRVIDCGPAPLCPPCPLKIITSLQPCYSPEQPCIWTRGRFKVVCQDGSTLTNWITSNGITGDITWETVSGNGGFNGGTCGSWDPLGTAPFECGYRKACYSLSTNSWTLESAWWCHCAELEYTPTVEIKATIRFIKNGVVCTRVVSGIFSIPTCETFRKAEVDWSLAPNPTKGSFRATVQVKEQSDIGIMLVSADGSVSRMVINKSIPEGTSTLYIQTAPDLLPGTYNVVLYVNGKIKETKQLVIQR